MLGRPSPIVGRVLLFALFALALVACRGTLEVGIEPPSTPAQVGAPLPRRDLSGLLVRDGDSLVLFSAGQGEPEVIGPLPADASHLSLGSRYLAYVHQGAIHALDLESGGSTLLLDLRDRPHADFHLLWSADGSTLAYSVAWSAAGGGRMIEIGVTDGYAQRTLDTLVTPEAAPGPVLFQIMGYDRAEARLVARPLGGPAPALWAYDANTGQRSEILEVPPETLALALDSQARKLALVLPGELQLWPLDAGAELRRLPLPAETYAAWLCWSPDGERLAYTLHEGTLPGLAVSAGLGVWVWPMGEDRAWPAWQTMHPELALLGWTADGSALAIEALDGVTRQRSVVLGDAEGGAVVPFGVVCAGCRVVGWLGSLP